MANQAIHCLQVDQPNERQRPARSADRNQYERRGILNLSSTCNFTPARRPVASQLLCVHLTLSLCLLYMSAASSSIPSSVSTPSSGSSQAFLSWLTDKIGSLSERPELLLFLGAVAAVLHSVISYLIWGPPEKVKQAREQKEQAKRDRLAGKETPKASSSRTPLKQD